MKKALAFLALVFVTGCASEPVTTEQSTNKEVPVSLLFEYDGCKVYRFYDGGRNIYFSKCEVRSQMSWNEGSKASESTVVTTDLVKK